MGRLQPALPALVEQLSLQGARAVGPGHTGGLMPGGFAPIFCQHMEAVGPDLLQRLPRPSVVQPGPTEAFTKTASRDSLASRAPSHPGDFCFSLSEVLLLRSA